MGRAIIPGVGLGREVPWGGPIQGSSLLLGRERLWQGWDLLTKPLLSPCRSIPLITLAIISPQTPPHQSAPPRGLQVGGTITDCKGVTSFGFRRATAAYC